MFDEPKFTLKIERDPYYIPLPPEPENPAVRLYMFKGYARDGVLSPPYPNAVDIVAAAEDGRLSADGAPEFWAIVRPMRGAESLYTLTEPSRDERPGTVAGVGVWPESLGQAEGERILNQWLRDFADQDAADWCGYVVKDARDGSHVDSCWGFESAEFAREQGEEALANARASWLESVSLEGAGI